MTAMGCPDSSGGTLGSGATRPLAERRCQERPSLEIHATGVIPPPTATRRCGAPASALGVIPCRSFESGVAVHVRPSGDDQKTARSSPSTPCLLYTSDAADDLLCVDLGGRRIIK